MRPETLRSDEVTTLLGFLEAQRDIVREKTKGFTSAELAMQHAPSSISLGGLLRHLARVEHDWSVRVWAGLPHEEPWASAEWGDDIDWDWRFSAEDDADRTRAEWEAACARTNELILASPDLDDDPAMQPYVAYEGSEARVSKRFVLMHLVEEVARHAGHADLIAEAIDGRTGQ